MDPLSAAVLLGGIALFASIVNGALGYGFSSITVPLALLFLVGRILNPALVLVEVAINVYVLAANWGSVGAAFGRTWTIVVGLLPGVVGGSLFLAWVSPEYVKLVAYSALLPLILIQTAGLRRPIHAEHQIGLPFGAGLGLLYSLTTVSGPPLAVMLNNQGYAKRDFRASLAVVRVAESSMTAIAYMALGLYTPASLNLLPAIVPAVLIGVPIGTVLIRRLNPEVFRRVCMSFDAWIVGFGLSRELPVVHVVPEPIAYLVLLAVGAIDIALLYRFLKRRRPIQRAFSDG